MREITSRLYGRWIQSWEERLCYRATNRVVRRFEWGLDWSGDWPCAVRYPKNGDGVEDYISKLNQIAMRDSDEFFAYERPADFRLADGILQFRSPVDTRYPENNVVHAQHWRHDDGPHPTLCVIHGFMGSSYLANGRFFTLPWYYRSGYDVLMYTLPFHGPRAEKYSPFSGFGYFAGGLGGFAEAMAQAVHDFRSIIDYLRHTGVDRIALTGISLGGYTSTLVASVDDRLEAVIPNCPVVTPATMLDDWFPANKLMGLGLRMSKISRDELKAGLSYHSPLNYRPLVPQDRRMIITGLGDRMAPPGQAVMLWEHWNRCALHWFPGSHVLHVSQLDYLRRMTQFLRQVMF